MLDGFQVGTVVNALGKFYDLVQQRLLITLSSGIRVKPYLLQTATTILWQLNNRSAKVRQQAADLTTRLAFNIKQCGEDQQLHTLGLVLFEQLDEEYPDTLGSIIAAEGAIANVMAMTQINPPVKDLLPRITPHFGLRCSRTHSRTVILFTVKPPVQSLSALLGVASLGCEDSMLHLMNLVWPNCFETSPHVIGAAMDAIEAMRVTLGPGVLLSYVLHGLFHPTRKVREVYWRISHFEIAF
jgi:hypothetical protein